MPRKPTVAIVGPGRLGSAMAVALRAAGYRVTELVSREPRRVHGLARKIGARAVAPAEARLDAKVVWFCVPDGEITATAREFARSTDWRGKIALHPSGALASSELDALRRRGAAAASLHPMMSFPGKVQPKLKGVPFAVEGDAPAVRAASQIARDVGGEPLKINATSKPLYHAWGAFASPLLVALLAVGERVGKTAGVPPAKLRHALAPILQQTLANYLERGVAGAFSGPLVRGDVATIRKHVRGLKRVPEAYAVYAALVRSAVRNLPVKKKKEILALLGKN